MRHLLLPLLLCLSLIASAVGSAWAATAMALPVQAVHAGDAATAPPCHETAPAPKEQTPPPCGDGNHCHCLQAASELPAAPMAMAAVRPAPMVAGNQGGQPLPPPPPLIRPPIA